MSLTDIQNKLEQKLDVLNISLGTLKDQQKALLENADKVKSCINIAVETQVNSLKGRERQLIRQVDVVTAHQKSLIDYQIAKLMHTKGSLSATQEILQNHNLGDVEMLSKIIEGNLLSVRPEPQMKLISAQLDANPLNLAISSFGSVHLPDSVTHLQSSVIPAKVEDYSDSEHDVLFKNLDNSSSTVVKVQLPKVPPNSWLAISPQKLPPSLPCFAERKLSKDVSSWLADLRVSQNLEDNKLRTPTGFEENHYYLLDSPTKLSAKNNRSRCSSISSSIEIVTCEETEKESCCMTENDEDTSNSRWLSSRSTASDKPPSCYEFVPLGFPRAVDEEFACQANEPCRSYDHCLCDGYCEALAKERSSQNSRWLLKTSKAAADKTEFPSPSTAGVKRKLSAVEGCDKVMNQVSKIMNSSSESWLSDESQRKAVKGLPKPSDVSLVYKPPSKPWLLVRPMSEASWLPSQESPHRPPTTRFSPHSNNWLLRKYKEELKLRQESESECQEQRNDDSALAMSDLKGTLVELAAFVPRISDHFPSTDAGTLDQTMRSTPKTNLPSMQRLCHALSHQDSVGREWQRKLKWLSNSQSQSPLPGHVDVISRSPSFLPQSLVVFAENNLDKWLMNRL